MRTLLVLLISIAGMGVLAVPAQAQTIWSRPYQPNQIALEAVVPDLPADDASAASGAAFLTATRSLNDNVELAVELPVARYATDATASTAVGNPYVGIGLSSSSRPILLELGIRIPAAPTNEALRAGQRADPGRTAAFRDESVAPSALLNGRLPLGRRASLRLRTGLTYASADRLDEEGTENRWRLPYSAQLWWNGERFMSGLSVEGRPRLSGSEPDRSTHRAVVSVMLDGGRVQPGLLAGTGLDPLVQDGRFVTVAGLTVSVSYSR
ncbi:hypothetical protein [Salinibacter altiplanensis]|uniref:hypothetical protein n=1 Tax=Salinibacter altiplanensis TaxID=1803181 RepID=UPI000C9EDCAE|nr:hypothetical protein [Salinibacter altiplanensis]